MVLPKGIKSKEKGFVYIIESKSNGRYYIGICKNPEERLSRHNRGGVVATKNKGPWVMVFKQEFLTMADAMKVENKLKKDKNKNIIREIIRDGFIKSIGA